MGDSGNGYMPSALPHSLDIGESQFDVDNDEDGTNVMSGGRCDNATPCLNSDCCPEFVKTAQNSVTFVETRATCGQNERA